MVSSRAGRWEIHRHSGTSLLLHGCDADLSVWKSTSSREFIHLNVGCSLNREAVTVYRELSTRPKLPGGRDASTDNMLRLLAIGRRITPNILGNPHRTWQRGAASRTRTF